MSLRVLALAVLVATAAACQDNPSEPEPTPSVPKLIITQAANGVVTMVSPGTAATLGLTSHPQMQQSSSSASVSSTITGGDLGGLDLIPSAGDVLSGTFTNVGTFSVQPGVTVFIDPGVDLSVSASSILIEGTIDGTGAGFAGGVTPAPVATPGQPGQGPGGGAGGNYGPYIHGPGGGGGGYGGPGGAGGKTFSTPAEALGGPAYGVAAPPNVQKGSGGGSAANHGQTNGTSFGGPGGAGGGAISLTATTITVNGGSILASGANGQPGTDGFRFLNLREGAGGGGSGGGIWLDGGLSLSGASLSANGGNGGNVATVPAPLI